MNSQTERNSILDILKGICIVFIVITHFSWTAEERLKYLFPFWIDMAVPTFMIISGYVYAVSYKRNGINDILSAWELKNTLSKMIRYTIPFVIAYVVEEVWLLYVDQFGSLYKAIARFICGGAGPGSYYYPVMMQFVFFYPIVFAIIKKYNCKGLLICGFLNLMYEIFQRAYSLNSDTYRLLIFRYILLISAGCYIAIYGVTWGKRKAIFAIIIGAAFIILVEYIGYKPRIIIYWTRTSFIAALFIIPIVTYIICKLNSLKCAVLELLGKASYNIFLVQMVWYISGSLVVEKYVTSRAIHLLINLVCCLITGIVFYEIESRITKKINLLIKGLY